MNAILALKQSSHIHILPSSASAPRKKQNKEVHSYVMYSTVKKSRG